MSQLVEKARGQLREAVSAALAQAVEAGELPQAQPPEIVLEVPGDRAHGDWSCNAAMAGARAFHAAPRKIAEAIVSHLDLTGSFFQKCEIAGPGFLNFTYEPGFYGQVLQDIEALGTEYGKSALGQGRRVLVEYVSANPTGPMHIGNARGGVLGDALASVLARAGYQVWREFYVNDAGNQIHKFAVSIEARYMQLVLGEDAVPFPEDGYHGDDIRELAQAFLEQEGPGWKDRPEDERQEAMAQFGLKRNIPKMQEDLRRYQIEYDEWFLESTLHNSGYVEETVGLLEDKGWTYEKDGALWLNTTQLAITLLVK